MYQTNDTNRRAHFVYSTKRVIRGGPKDPLSLLEPPLGVTYFIQLSTHFNNKLMGLDVTKSVLGVSDKVILKPTCTATETS